MAYAKYPNVAVKLSAIPGFSDRALSVSRYERRICSRMIDAFGPRRCFWGTDLTHQRGKVPYRLYVTHFTEELEFLSDDDRRRMMGDACWRSGWNIQVLEPG